MKFLHLLIARSPKNPMETLATPDGRRQFQGDTHRPSSLLQQFNHEDVMAVVRLLDERMSQLADYVTGRN